MSVTQVQSTDEFKNKLKEAGNKLVVVDFYATWCGPCRQIAPKIQAMAKEHTDVVFLKVDVEELDDLAAEYEISCMPTFVFIKQGAKVTSFSGANADKLLELVTQNK
ncbi:thioredoxin-like [Amphibalanus amphitrite]|uniref:thioredoxin-like n=1 Tax=Amphibalanus amphitrite TaxID=1232801 RepID=UPI001C927D33|nr:thioredoxin-like [Amphibalanus amphitrite]XP_043224504.1 thioredoxin-like [Amphibalanus amphitrite]